METNFYHWGTSKGLKIFTNQVYSITENCLDHAIKIEKIRAKQGIKGLNIEFKKETLDITTINDADTPIDFSNKVTQKVYTKIILK